MRAHVILPGQHRVQFVPNNRLAEIKAVTLQWSRVTFSKTGHTVYYRGRTLQKTGGQGVRGNFRNQETGEEYWVSGVKKRGSNAHWAEAVKISVDADAFEEYSRLRQK